MTAERDRLVEEFLSLAEAIARAVMRTLPPSFEYDDLYQAGCVGLIAAAEAFDESRGVPFRAFAQIRIRGAIVDSIRRRHYRNATHLPITERVVEMPGAGVESVERHVEHAERARMVCQAKEALPADQRKVIEIYFEQEGKLEGIGQHFGIRQSRSSQRLQDAKRALQRQLEDRGLKAA